MKEYTFSELGYFTKSECENIKAAIDGKTYMHFEVSYCNFAGNCILVVRTDYDATEAEIKNFFLSCALSTLARAGRA